MSSLAELKKLRAADLRDQLGAIGLPTTGLKADLVQRLYDALNPGGEPDEQTAPDAAEPDERAESPPAPAAPPAQSPPTAPPVSEQERMAMRAARFGLPVKKPVIAETTLDGGLSTKPTRKRDRDSAHAPKLNLDDPDVQRRLQRFGVPSDESSAVAKAVRAAEQDQRRQERLARFGGGAAGASEPAASAQELQDAMAARKARFGT
ncbi:unnamed protein product (mitochondrion) [Plasmodiophora brassicae]|uniref:SAP domain-containing protein n=2 Tax=Plasmodiophora brassicae TaxID=37360 RepID=A0A3P3YA54_PLABS|nr:unnamed protein product [Plasmodiophora brassicae]SPQ97047.1 unnamed protein product [Plasmodiophora brassicae]